MNLSNRRKRFLCQSNTNSIIHFHLYHTYVEPSPRMYYSKHPSKHSPHPHTIPPFLGNSPSGALLDSSGGVRSVQRSIFMDDNGVKIAIYYELFFNRYFSSSLIRGHYLVQVSFCGLALVGDAERDWLVLLELRTAHGRI
ncbi:hypothetical protein CEXT_620621 [Caerostris extrusa]|uniref:Uncharacterized protein n=1 Tax=Caerostris extrusa TaxID=172846 RepID=A0AAV4QGQ8_CAEEX|nr:hypothetical protein CEXT_620621 [Caerostris extrusa]